MSDETELLPALAEVLTDVARASTAEQVAETSVRGIETLLHADCISLNLRDRQCIEFWPERHESQAFQASITVEAVGEGLLRSLGAHWKKPRTVSSQDRAVLTALTQSAALAFRSTAQTSAAQPATGQYIARERARFFDFQRQVRSLLAVIRSIVRRAADSPQTKEEFAAHLEGRVDALARVQGMLLRAPDAKVDLEELLHAEFLAQSMGEDRARTAGPKILLSGKAAESLALVFHELTTNAIKFGALGRAQGTVLVVWDWEPGATRCVRLEWREHSEPVAPVGAIERGFGLELIEKTLPYELGATASISIGTGGAHCVIEFTSDSEGLRAQEKV